MDATTLLITVYCPIDEWLAGRRLRQRGPQPILADSEVLTIECVGEFWGIDTDKACMSTSAATGATGSRLWAGCTAPPWCGRRPTCGRSKPRLRQQLLGQVSFDPQVLILDSFPMPACRFTPRRPLSAAGWAGRLRP